MKKQLAVVLAILFATTVFCQDDFGETGTENKLRFGVKAGMAFSNLQIEYRSAPNTYFEKRTGLIAGVLIRTPLDGSLYFQPELLIVRKGYKQQEEFYNSGLNLTYLELPLNVLYRFYKSGGGFFIGAGAAPSIRISQRRYYFGDRNIKEFDFGINALACYEHSIGFSINLNYTHGLVNLSPDKENVTTIRNRSVGLTVAYLFQ